MAHLQASRGTAGLQFRMQRHLSRQLLPCPALTAPSKRFATLQGSHWASRPDVSSPVYSVRVQRKSSISVVRGSMGYGVLVQNWRRSLLVGKRAILMCRYEVVPAL